MMKFWEVTASSLATRLLAASGAAVVFWLWVIAVWSIRQGGWTYVESTLQPLLEAERVAPLLALVVSTVIVVCASCLLIGRLTLPTLRLLEGYWPSIAEPLRSYRVRHWQQRLNELGDLPDNSATSTSLTTTQVQMWRFPIDADVMPTRVGNIIRGGERRPFYWYGLDAVIVWPQLWLVLPERVRADVTHAREQLDRAVAALIWALLSCGLATLWPWAAIVSIIGAWTIWRWWIPAAAESYAIIVGAVFDTHRLDLYDALHYPRPSSTAVEKDLGRALTRSLWSDLGDHPRIYTAN